MATEDVIAGTQSTFLKALFAGNRADCEQLLSPDFSALRPNDDHTIAVVLHDQWLDEIAGRAVEHVDITDTVISAHGDLAVATTLWVENPASNPVPRCATDVWTRSADGWRLLERHTGWCATKT